MGDRPQHELFGALRRLYQQRDFCDLVIITRDGGRHVTHKAIVCPRSEVLAEKVKSGNWHNGIEGEIGVQDDDPVVIAHCIEYLYLLDYEPAARAPSVSSHHGSDSGSSRTDAINYGHVYGTAAVSAFGGPRDRDSLSTHMPFTTAFSHHRDRSESQLTVHALPGSDFPNLSGEPRRRRTSRGTAPAPDPSPLATREPNLILHAKMYAAAERYGISGLKALALDKFKIQTTRHWDSVEFAEAIHIVYDSTSSSDKEMREAVADTIGWHGRLLDKPEIEIAIMEINGLAYELLKRSRRAEPEYD